MKRKHILIATVTISLLCLFNQSQANQYTIEDAERFAQLFTHSVNPNENHIKTQYLDLGSKGIQIFTPYRIQNEKNLTQAIIHQSKKYQKAINICLPAAREISSDANKILIDVQTLLNQEKIAPVFVLFGAGNSGGTANHEGLALGLEVLCEFVDNKEDAKTLILSYIAHELVHVYQSRLEENNTQEATLLYQSLSEGFADFVENRILGNISKAELARHDYGLNNEALIWSEFKQVMYGTLLQPWMYGDGVKGRPKDLGYWLGKRIVETYYQKALDKNSAIKELLQLKDPNIILQRSGYNPQ